MNDTVGATQCVAPTPNGPKPRSIGAIVGSFKSAVTKRIHEIDPSSGMKIWQRNYYENIIRNDVAHNHIHLYIESNPSLWEEDEENPVLIRNK